jgi:hypothetical protein
MKAQQSFAEPRGLMAIAHEERSGGSYSFEIDRGWHGPGSQRQVHGADRRAVRCIYYRDVASASQKPCGRWPRVIRVRATRAPDNAPTV